MASSQIKIGGVTKDIHDHRLPSTLGTADQVLKMNSGGTAIEWGTSGGSSTHMYEHLINAQFVSSYGFSGYIRFTFISNVSTPISSSYTVYCSEIATALSQVGYNSAAKQLPINAVATYTSNNKTCLITSIYADGSYLRYEGNILNIADGVVTNSFTGSSFTGYFDSTIETIKQIS